ncbi:hypothetical protein [Roseiconus lacunae]|uniref:DUF4349 domain-containing protein n=1 Tax=Roseiconus lacunae TaxID=2605694 RepID=A0ABT7PH57_9BACT|nr:hypothetical protein [Roseiconus lacunae]MDM4015820.1 hypothetical protein [Roseiconus lacunae]
MRNQTLTLLLAIAAIPLLIGCSFDDAARDHQRTNTPDVRVSESASQPASQSKETEVDNAVAPFVLHPSHTGSPRPLAGEGPGVRAIQIDQLPSISPPETVFVAQYGVDHYGGPLGNETGDETTPPNVTDLDDAPEISFRSPPPTAPEAPAANYVTVDRDALDALQASIDDIRHNMATKDDVIDIREDIAKLRKLIIQYQTADGQTKTAAVPVDSAGNGEIDLPDDAIVTTIGGLPVASDPATGASYVETYSTPAADQCYIDPATGNRVCPMARVTVTDTPLVTTRRYESPGQFHATTTQTSNGNRFRVRVQSGPTGPVRRVLGRLFGG